MELAIVKKQEVLWFILILLFSLFFISADAFEGLKVYDEGVTVYGASLVLEGALPYRDFWTVYMPGNYYLYAFVFKIFSPSLLVERVTSILLMIGIAIFSFLIARKLLPKMYALLAFFFAAVWLSSFDFFGYVIYPTLLCSLASFNFFLRYLLHKDKKLLYWAGAMVGMTALFRHDFGFYVFLSETVIIVFSKIFYGHPTENENLRIAIKNFLRLTVGTAAVFMPVAIYFMIHVPLEVLIRDLIIFPLYIYADYREIPFPPPFITYAHFQQIAENATIDGYLKENLNRIYLYFPLIVYAALLLQLIIRSLNHSGYRQSKMFWGNFGLLVLGSLFFTKVAVRSLYLHLMPTYVVAIIVFFVVLTNVYKAISNSTINRMACLFLYLLAIPTLIRPFWSESVNMKESGFGQKETLNIPRAEHIQWDERGAEYKEVIRYVHSLVPEHEKIFVGNTRHDRIFTNDVLFYFLSNRESPTKYYELHPGVATTREVQQQIVHDIASSGVKVIVLKEETRVETVNKSGKSSGITLLDDFIRNNYRLNKDFGEYTVWVKKGSKSASMIDQRTISNTSSSVNLKRANLGNRLAR